MTIQMIPKNTSGNDSASMKITLQGHHTMKQKGAMFFDAKYFLQHEYNLRSASRIVLFVHFIDQWGHPLTHLPNGNPINGADMVVNSPYHCAADLYRAGELFEHSHPIPRHPQG